jgi:hypothetical protein
MFGINAMHKYADVIKLVRTGISSQPHQPLSPSSTEDKTVCQRLAPVTMTMI